MQEKQFSNHRLRIQAGHEIFKFHAKASLTEEESSELVGTLAEPLQTFCERNGPVEIEVDSSFTSVPCELENNTNDFGEFTEHLEQNKTSLDKIYNEPE